MSNLNRIILIGKATTAPESGMGGGSGNVTAKTVLAVNRMPRPDGTFETDLIPVVASQRSAEYLLQNIQAGDVMLAEGRIQVRTEELSGGKRNWVTEVVADQITKLDASGVVRASNQAAAPMSSENNMEAHTVVDDIPF